MTIREALARLLDGRDLTQDEARETMEAVMRGEATPAQIGGFLGALRVKGETADEIAGFAEAMRSHVLEVRPALELEELYREGDGDDAALRRAARPVIEANRA